MKQDRFAVGLGCAGLFAVTVTAAMVYLGWANALPDLDNPEQPLVAEPPPDLASAVSALGEPPGYMPPVVAYPIDHTWDAASEIRARVREAKAELEHLQAALASVPAGTWVSPSNSVFHETLRWLDAEAIAYHLERKGGAAADRGLDGLELTCRAVVGADAEYALTSAETAVAAASLSVPDLSADDARKAGTRVERVLRALPPEAELTGRQRRWHLREFRGVLAGEPMYFPQALSLPVTYPLEGLQLQLVRVLRAAYPKSRASRQVDAYYAHALAESVKPFPQRREPPHPKDRIACEYVRSNGWRRGELLIEVTALLHILRTELALQEYRSLHGRYPESLEDLAPLLAEEYRTDPCTGKPLRFVRSPKKRFARPYLLYSTGADGKDDGGRIPQTLPLYVGGGSDLIAGHFNFD